MMFLRVPDRRASETDDVSFWVEDVPLVQGNHVHVEDGLVTAKDSRQKGTLFFWCVCHGRLTRANPPGIIVERRVDTSNDCNFFLSPGLKKRRV